MFTKKFFVENSIVNPRKASDSNLFHYPSILCNPLFYSQIGFNYFSLCKSAVGLVELVPFKTNLSLDNLCVSRCRSEILGQGFIQAFKNILKLELNSNPEKHV